MVQSNKVLTVSYGTFSCTLEGFEDSFETMKAIAEYFRDLAADDRYFGAEPPQPDAEMLARIAEREIARQVEARREGSGIVLRAAQPLPPGGAAAETAPGAAATTALPRTEAAVAAETGPPPQPAAEMPEPAPAPSAQPAAETDGAQAGLAHAPEAERPDAPPAPSEIPVAEPVEPPQQPAPDSIAAKLARIRAVVARNEQAAQGEPYDEDASESSPSGPTGDFTAMVAEDMTRALEADAEAVEGAIEGTGDVPEPTAGETGEPAPETAGGAPAEAIPPEEDIIDEFEAALAEAEAPAAPEQTLAAEIESLPPVTPPVTAPEPTPEPPPEPVEAMEEQEPQETAQEPDAAGPLDDDTVPSEGAPLADAASRPSAEDSLFGDLQQELTEDGTGEEAAGDDIISNILAQDDEDGEEYEDETEVAESGESREGIARVLRIKRHRLEAALSAGELEELPENAAGDRDSGAEPAVAEATPQAGSEPAPEPAPAPAGGSAAPPAVTTLSPEDEAELMRELAEVEASFLGERPMPADRPSEPKGPRSTASPLLGEDADRDVARLLDEADEKLSDPEAAARHETYSHMRAAVATTRAERMAGGTMGTYASDDPYREDLASVVRPRRPAEEEAHPPRRPAPGRQAPLRLVAEQRVDTGSGIAARGVVRPRRISTRMLADEPEAAAIVGRGFAEYAARNGASELPDLLEAAAAYLTFVEGREQFSRPQLMSMVQQVATERFNREDGLRAFGQLLRDGKIERRGGGRFSVSGEIGFRPDQRATG